MDRVRSFITNWTLDPALGPPKTKVEDLNGESKTVLNLDIFDGVRVDYNKTVNEHLLVGHHFTFGSSQCPGSYDFSCQYAHNQQLMAYARGAPGNLSLRVHALATENTTVKLNTQITPNPHGTQAMLDIDTVGATHFHSFKFGSMGTYGFSFLQSITNDLSLGCELMHCAKRGMTLVDVVGRYVGPDHKWVATGQIGPMGTATATYWHKANERSAFSTELELSAYTGDSSCNLGYQFTIRKAVLKAAINSSGRILTTMEKATALGPTLLLSAMVNFKGKGEYKFGYGLSIGQ